MVDKGLGDMWVCLTRGSHWHCWVKRLGGMVQRQIFSSFIPCIFMNTFITSILLVPKVIFCRQLWLMMSNKLRYQLLHTLLGLLITNLVDAKLKYIYHPYFFLNKLKQWPILKSNQQKLTLSGHHCACWYRNTVIIRLWIANYIHHKVWDNITNPFPNFNSVTIFFLQQWQLK